MFSPKPMSIALLNNPIEDAEALMQDVGAICDIRFVIGPQWSHEMGRQKMSAPEEWYNYLVGPVHSSLAQILVCPYAFIHARLNCTLTFQSCHCSNGINIPLLYINIPC